MGFPRARGGGKGRSVHNAILTAMFDFFGTAESNNRNKNSNKRNVPQRHATAVLGLEAASAGVFSNGKNTRYGKQPGKKTVTAKETLDLHRAEQRLLLTSKCTSILRRRRPQRNFYNSTWSGLTHCRWPNVSSSFRTVDILGLCLRDMHFFQLPCRETRRHRRGRRSGRKHSKTRDKTGTRKK